MFHTINQDYGSFYYRKSTSPCIPDVLKEKVYKRHEQFMNQVSHCQPESQCQNNLFPQYHTQTVTITHRKKYPTSNTNELIIDFLVSQIQQRLKASIDPSDYHDVMICAKILVTELLNQQPSLCAKDVINRVITTMSTRFPHSC